VSYREGGREGRVCISWSSPAPEEWKATAPETFSFRPYRDTPPCKTRRIYTVCILTARASGNARSLTDRMWGSTADRNCSLVISYATQSACPAAFRDVCDAQHSPSCKTRRISHVILPCSVRLTGRGALAMQLHDNHLSVRPCIERPSRTDSRWQSWRRHVACRSRNPNRQSS